MSCISKNIRYLRKTKGISQEKLAQLLETKRSNIASYESKNIEPRLEMLVKIARFFDVDFAALIEKDLSQAQGASKVFIDQYREGGEKEGDGSFVKTLSEAFDGDAPKFAEFIDRSGRMKKISEGFKVYFRMKLGDKENRSKEIKQMALYIENFMDLMERLLDTNDKLIDMVSSRE